MRKTLLLFFFIIGAQTLSAQSPIIDHHHLPLAENKLLFSENKGQWGSWIQYGAEFNNGALAIEKDAITFFLWNTEVNPTNYHQRKRKEGYIYRIRFLNANSSAFCTAEIKKKFYRNYYYGQDPSRWTSDVSVFEKAIVKNIYPNIDLELFGEYAEIKYQFVVHPGGNPENIKWNYEGVENPIIRNKEIQYNYGFGKVTEKKPIVYQTTASAKKIIPSAYQNNQSEFGIKILQPSKIQPSTDLIIDPTLIFSSYTGSGADNFGFTATYDNLGNFYAGGNVYPTLLGYSNYPTVGPVQASHSGGTQDIAISKFNANGTALLFSTYLGGFQDDLPHSLVVNNNNELYVLGTSESPNFPVTAGSYDNGLNGQFDITVTKFNAAGNSLLASTFVGGNQIDGHNNEQTISTFYNFGDSSRGEIIVDSLSNVYVATCTRSSNFPIVNGFQNTFGGNTLDAVVFKLSPNLNNLLWSTFIGGNGLDAAYSLKLDTNLNVFVAGGTSSSNFPTTSGAYDPSYNGGITDGFLCKLNNNGNALLASTFLGTSSYDQCFFVEVDDSSYVYVVGQTLGSYPVSPAVYSNSNGPQFLHKFNNSLNQSIASTVFGNGSQINISPTAFLVDECYNIYVAGWGGEVNHYHNPNTGGTSGLPTTSDAMKPTTDGSDLYFIVFTHNFSQLLFGSFFGANGGGGEHVDGGTCRFNKKGVIYSAVCAGCGGNSLFPTTPLSWSATNNSPNCNLAALKIDLDLADTEVSVNANPTATGCVPLIVNFQSVTSNVQNVYWDFGDGNTSTQFNPTYTYTDTGHFTVRLIGENPFSCNQYDTSYLEVWVRDDTLTAHFESNIELDCDSLKFTAAVASDSGTIYTWTFSDGATYNDSAVVHFFPDTGVYQITLHVTNSNNCNLEAQWTENIFLVNDIDPILASSNTQGCSPLTSTFQSNFEEGDIFLWTIDDTIEINGNPVSHTFYDVGIHNIRLVVIDTQSCFYSDTTFFTATVYETPDANFNVIPDSVKWENRVDFINLTPSFTSLLWQFGDGSSTTLVNPFYTYPLPGIYTPCLIAFNGASNCADTICKEVEVTFIPLAGIPNAFSPNGDGVNDVLYLEGQGLKTVDFRIYNRWGQLVFQTDKPDMGWDGFYKGQLQDMDTYVYQADITFINGAKDFLKGNLTLLR